MLLRADRGQYNEDCDTCDDDDTQASVLLKPESQCEWARSFSSIVVAIDSVGEGGTSSGLVDLLFSINVEFVTEALQSQFDISAAD